MISSIRPPDALLWLVFVDAVLFQRGEKHLPQLGSASTP